MKRYTKNSKVRELKVVRSAGSESFYAEIIKDPANNISKSKQRIALEEISKLVERSWGKFPKKYLEGTALHSQRLLLLRNNKKQLIGVAPIKKIQIDGHYVYSFGLTAVDPDYQGLGFMKKMHAYLGRGVFIESILHGKLKVEFVFITPNIRTIGALAKVADFIYPNPYVIDEKTGKIEYADDKTWETVKLYLKATGENYRKLDRNVPIVECTSTTAFRSKVGHRHPTRTTTEPMAPISMEPGLPTRMGRKQANHAIPATPRFTSSSRIWEWRPQCHSHTPTIDY